MVDAGKIPENIRQDISIYLGPEETIIKALSSVSGKIEAIGEIWMILTTKSIFFHTREFEKESVIALISRSDIKEIDYFQKPTEIALTFYPRLKQKNTTRLSFPIEKKKELEDFCEEIADLISFRMETASGVRFYPKPDEQKTESTGKEQTQKASNLTKDSVKSGTDAPEKKPVVEPLVKGKTKTEPSIKSEKLAESFVKPERNSGPKVKIVSSADTELNKKSDTKSGPEARFVIIATVVSVLVAFIWYQFFKALARKSQG
ncbi:MAG: hypothetical protein PWR01_2569 [Clostridiales bacterium]|nr:hypothetical protein [Clostridiales bacterium]MDN5281496.1 hypothetical protein [Candidatus Ozemobacter sp.]